MTFTGFAVNTNSFAMSSVNKNASGSASVFAGNMPMLQNMSLKSTQEKLARQQEAANQVEFWENQKENLKNMECDTLEDIANKLDILSTYEDEIAAAKAAYNNEQMFHILDEAKEQGEKIAEEAEKRKPKTKEERKDEILEEIAEEVSGVDESLLEEILDAEEIVPEEDLETEDSVLKEMTEQVQDIEDIVKAREGMQNYRPLDIRI